MKFTADTAPGGAIEGFRGRGFKIGGIAYPGGVIAHGGGAAAWGATDVTALTPADFAGLPAADLLIVGTGAVLARPPAGLVAALAPLAVEAMDSRAAARTYNVLLAEGRRVVAALLPL